MSRRCRATPSPPRGRWAVAPARGAAWLLLFLALLPGVARAACTVTTTPVAFGNYSPSNPAPTDSTGAVTVTCVTLLSLLSGYTIQISGGSYGTQSVRQMGSGNNRLRYQLYTDSTRTTIWGNGTGGTITVQHPILLGLLNFTASDTVYGRIPAGQNVAPGSYIDTLTVVVNY